MNAISFPASSMEERPSSLNNVYWWRQKPQVNEWNTRTIVIWLEQESISEAVVSGTESEASLLRLGLFEEATCLLPHDDREVSEKVDPNGGQHGYCCLFLIHTPFASIGAVLTTV